MIISPGRGEKTATLCDSLMSMSHRLEELTTAQALGDFAAYAPGIPHCSGISFLADAFGLPHRRTCYIG